MSIGNITYNGVTFSDNAPTVTKPAGGTTGSAYILTVIITAGQTVTWPSGFTEINTSASEAVNVDIQMRTAIRLHTGTEGASFAPTPSGYSGWKIVCVLVHNYSSLAANSSNGVYGSAGTARSLIGASLNTGGSNRRVLFLGYTAGGGGTNSATFTPPSGFTSDLLYDLGNGSAFVVADKVIPTSTTAGYTGTVTLANSAGNAELVNTLAIVEVTPGPTINTEPTNQTVAVGATATFSCSATTSGGALTYQWQDNSSGSFANISGANSSSYTTPATTGAFNGRQYRCNCTDSNGTNTTATAALTVTGLPAITSVSSATPAVGSTLTVTGTGLKDAGNSTASIGGAACAVTVQSATVPQINVARGSNKYGVALTVQMTTSGGESSNAYAGITGLLPQSGWSYVNIGTPNTTSSYRVTAVGDLASGDQLAYDNKGGLVTMSSDGTFVADPSVTSFDCELWTSGSGWGSVGTQTLGAGGGGGGSSPRSGVKVLGGLFRSFRIFKR